MVTPVLLHSQPEEPEKTSQLDLKTGSLRKVSDFISCILTQ